MIRSLDHAIDLIAKRKANGKKGLPKAVKRYLKRTKQTMNKLIDNATLVVSP